MIRLTLLSRTLLPCALALLLAACQSSGLYQHSGGVALAGKTVLLMPADIELTQLLVSGLEEPRPQWTQRADHHTAAALQSALRRAGARAQSFSADIVDATPRLQQLSRLHTQVAKAVLNHHLGNDRLPAKRQQLDWSLGAETRSLGGDYLLFVYLRDSYASRGRGLLQTLTPVKRPQQRGYLSLVNARSGKIELFNTTQGGAADVRGASGAQAIVAELLAGVPLP